MRYVLLPANAGSYLWIRDSAPSIAEATHGLPLVPSILVMALVLHLPAFCCSVVSGSRGVNQATALVEGVSVILTVSDIFVEVSCSEGRNRTQHHSWSYCILLILTLNLEIRPKSGLHVWFVTRTLQDRNSGTKGSACTCRLDISNLAWTEKSSDDC